MNRITFAIGQYLRPTPKHHPLVRYIPPEEFAEYQKMAEGKGFLMVSASPLTRSSYHAGDDFKKLRAARTQQLNKNIKVRPLQQTSSAIAATWQVPA